MLTFFETAASAERHPISTTAVDTMLTTMKGVGGTYPFEMPRMTRPSGAATAQHLAAVAAAAFTSPPWAAGPNAPRNGDVANQP